MTMAAMRASNHVRLPQLRADADRHRLLTGVLVGGAWDLAGVHESHDAVLKSPDCPHATVELLEHKVS